LQPLERSERGYGRGIASGGLLLTPQSQTEQLRFTFIDLQRGGHKFINNPLYPRKFPS